MNKIILPKISNFNLQSENQREQIRFLLENLYITRVQNFGFFTIFKQLGENKFPKNFTHHITHLHRAINRVGLNCDTFFTINLFKKRSRKQEFLRWINAVYIDCDFKDPTLSAADKVALAKKVCLEKVGFLPSIITSSGNGLHLYFLFTSPIKASGLVRWKLVQKEFCARLQEIHADPKALDASRVLRLPGTINTKNNTRCSVVYFTRDKDDSDIVQRYSFDELADKVLPVERIVIKNRRKAKAERQAEYLKKKAKREQQNKENLEKILKSLHAKNAKAGADSELSQKMKMLSTNVMRYTDLMTLLYMRSKATGVVPKGARNELLFWIMNFACLAELVNSKKFYAEAEKIAKKIDCCWDYESNGNLSTLYGKLLQHEQGKTIKVFNRDFPTLYTPKNDTLIRRLIITDDEQNHLKTLISSEKLKERNKSKVKQRREKQRRDKGIMSREEYLQRKEDKIKVVEYFKNFMTTKEMIKFLGFSRSSIYSYLKEIKNKKSAETPVYPRVQSSAYITISGYATPLRKELFCKKNLARCAEFDEKKFYFCSESAIKKPFYRRKELKQRNELRKEFVETFVNCNGSLFPEHDEKRREFFNFSKICDLFRPVLLDFLRLYSNWDEFVRYRLKHHSSHVKKLRATVQKFKKERKAKEKYFKDLLKQIKKSMVAEKKKRKANAKLKMKRKMKKSKMSKNSV